MDEQNLPAGYVGIRRYDMGRLEGTFIEPNTFDEDDDLIPYGAVEVTRAEVLESLRKAVSESESISALARPINVRPDTLLAQHSDRKAVSRQVAAHLGYIARQDVLDGIVKTPMRYWRKPESIYV